MAYNTNTPRSPVYLSSGLGDLFSLTDVRGIKLLGDGRLLFKGDTDIPVIVLDPGDYKDVPRAEVISGFKRMLLACGANKPVIIPDWMQKALDS